MHKEENQAAETLGFADQGTGIARVWFRDKQIRGYMGSGGLNVAADVPM